MVIIKQTLMMMLIYYFVLTKIDSKPLTHLKQNKCQDPSNESLEDQLSKEFKKILNKIEEGIDVYPPVQRKYNISKLIIDNEFSNSDFRKHGNQSCSLSEQTIWHTNEISICPHHFVEVKRKNRFPFNLKQAICNCKECIGVKKSKCLPVNIARPALERDFCNLDTGLFEWNFLMEYITVSCSCKQMLELD